MYHNRETQATTTTTKNNSKYISQNGIEEQEGHEIMANMRYDLNANVQ